MFHKVNTVAVILSILAIIVSIAALGYVSLHQPESVDLSEFSNSITANEVDITSLQYDLKNLQNDFEDISIPDISDDDLEDLEDYANDFKHIDDNYEDIKDIDKFLDCIQEHDTWEHAIGIGNCTYS